MHQEKELALLETAALSTEAVERTAESRLDAAFEAAEQSGSLASLTGTAEFREWMAARANTDAAWGRWAEIMQAREPAGRTADA